MEELILNDRGGAPIKQDEFIADKLMTYIEGLNPSLGTEADPKYNDFKVFMDDIKNTAILKIDPESISSGRFDDIDLTGDDKEKKSVANVDHYNYDYFMNQLLELVKFSTMFNMNLMSTPFDYDVKAEDAAFRLRDKFYAENKCTDKDLLINMGFNLD